MPTWTSAGTRREARSARMLRVLAAMPVGVNLYLFAVAGPRGRERDRDRPVEHPLGRKLAAVLLWRAWRLREGHGAARRRRSISMPVGSDEALVTSMPSASSLPGRLARYARIATVLGRFMARLAGERYLGAGEAQALARELTDALGRLRGPIVKVAQLLATVPGALPAEYVAELISLQSEAPPMGPNF